MFHRSTCPDLGSLEFPRTQSRKRFQKFCTRTKASLLHRARMLGFRVSEFNYGRIATVSFVGPLRAARVSFSDNSAHRSHLSDICLQLTLSCGSRANRAI